MIIKKNEEIPEALMEDEDVKKVVRKILIGPDDGSNNIIMRYFKVLPEGNTPFHSHAHEHVIKIEKGRGIVVWGGGEETIVSEGQSLFIQANEKHQFKNPFAKPFEFLCIIINPEQIESR